MNGLSPSSTQALIRLDSLPGNDWAGLLEECLRVGSSVLGVEFVSYWRFRAKPPAIVNELGYRATDDRLERGFILEEGESPRYFREIKRSQVLAIADAVHDERSGDIREYLMTRGIGALLDTAVRVGDEPVGILCHEHRGGARAWTGQEQQFAFALGHVLAKQLESRGRSDAEITARRSALLADVMTLVAEQFGSQPAAGLAVERALPLLGDLAVLVTVDGRDVRFAAATHIDPERRPLIDELMRLTPPSLDGRGFVAHALRERQALLVQTINREVARSYGLTDETFTRLMALRLRSAIAVPFTIRGELRGAMLFGSASRRFDPTDLQFAEMYAQRVGLSLENARLYRVAQDAVRARDEFLSLASHELRTPLATLCLFAEALAGEAGELSPRSVAQMSERMVRQIGRLDRLADRLLNASELEQGQPSINRESVDLTQIVDDVAHAFRSIAESAGSSLVMSCDGQVIGSFDPIRLQQVLGNLIDNAIKFGMGKPIEIDVRTRDGVALVSVQDHGPGIPPDEQAHLYDRYERGLAARGLGGLGLGLYLVKEIVAAHGGRLHLDTHPGEGTRFTLELPLGEPTPQSVTFPLGGGTSPRASHP